MKLLVYYIPSIWEGNIMKEKIMDVIFIMSVAGQTITVIAYTLWTKLISAHDEVGLSIGILMVCFAIGTIISSVWHLVVSPDDTATEEDGDEDGDEDEDEAEDDDECAECIQNVAKQVEKLAEQNAELVERFDALLELLSGDEPPKPTEDFRVPRPLGPNLLHKRPAGETITQARGRQEFNERL